MIEIMVEIMVEIFSSSLLKSIDHLQELLAIQKEEKNQIQNLD